MSQPYSFPPAPRPEAIEWPGTPIGAANVITRTKTRTTVSDKTIDRTPGKREALVAAAVAAGRDGSARSHDVVIHGVRVRATTNSPHLRDFWVDNWYSPEEWEAATGTPAPAAPRVTVYAMGEVGGQQEAAYYSRATDTIVFFNTAYYGQLKSWVLGAVGRVLAAEHGIHSIHGACVEMNGRGVLYIAPTGTGKSTSSYGLVEYSDTRFHSDDWVYVRYTYPDRDGRRIHPLRVIVGGTEAAHGYQVFRWLAERGRRAIGEATIEGLDLENRETALPLSALDLEAPIEAYAFTSEKVFYLRTNLVENFPLSADEMLASKMENAPDVTAAFLREHARLLDDLVEAIHRGGAASGRLAVMDGGQLRTLLARMIAFDNARAMLDIAKVLPAGRVFVNPMEPARLAAVILLRRDGRDPTILERLTLPEFLGRLLVGETPDRKREIAYNAYRAVDDRAEAEYIAKLERETAARGGRGHPAAALAETLAARDDVPQTLEEEFALFRVMHRAVRCYDLNTTLAADSRVRDTKEAVALTMRVLARLVETLPDQVHHTLENYRDFIGAGATPPAAPR